MAKPDDTPSMAVFCDFENVALGVRDAKYDKFDISKVLERLLLKGSIVVKKAYCDWGRYREFKAPMHEASFELIEIPHVRQSGKNSADIRLVVDALDLCYTKSHVDTFVIISGDSDFSPLVSKLRENNKTVIGVGVKGSTSDLLTANCDEFIFYDDLVREQRRRGAQGAARREPTREGRDAGREPGSGRESGRDTGRDTPRDAPRDAPRDGARDAGREARGPNGRNGREPVREPLRSVPTGPQPPSAPDEDTVGGPWRRHGAEPRDPTQTVRNGATDDDAANEDAREHADAAGSLHAEEDAAGPGPHADAGPDEAAAPVAPPRRTRRTRARAADVRIGLDADSATTAAEIAAADLAGLAAADTPEAAGAPEPAAAQAAPEATAPKKRAPRRRKSAEAEPSAEPVEPVEFVEPVEDPVEAAAAAAPDAGPPDADADAEADASPADAERDPDTEPARPRRSDAERRQEAIDLTLETVEALMTERGADDKIWGSMVKQTLKRRRPGFAESYYGYRSFNDLLEDARDRGLVALEHDEKSGGYVIRLL